LNLLALPVGLCIGLSLGALGGGGSVLTVPALVYVLGQDAHDATTGSLVVVGAAALAGTAAHARSAHVRFGRGLAFGALGVGGSYAGSRLSAGVDPDVLLLAFAGLMLLGAAAMARRARRAEPAPAAPRRDDGPVPCGSAGRPARARWRSAARVVGAASVVGLVTGFFGVGGGFFVVPALVLALGFEMVEAVGTSLLVIAVNSAEALLARLGTRIELDWALLAAFGAAAVVGAVLGDQVASRLPARELTRAFAALLAAVALAVAARSVAQLA